MISSRSPESSVLDGVIREVVRGGTTEPTEASLALHEGPDCPSAPPARGPIDAPWPITCALCEGSCASKSSVLDSVRHDRVRCDADELTGAPVLLPEDPR